MPKHFPLRCVDDFDSDEEDDDESHLVAVSNIETDIIPEPTKP